MPGAGKGDSIGLIAGWRRRLVVAGDCWEQTLTAKAEGRETVVGGAQTIFAP
jgi:hypothetical protein